MKDKIEEIKEIYNIEEVFPIDLITLNRKKVYLFSSKEHDVDYSLCTDGDIEHLDTWCDKKPYERDSFLKECQIKSGRWINRFEFSITDANVILVEKKYQDSIIRNLYINLDNIENIVKDFYQVTINSKDNLKIKKIGER